MVGGWQIKCFAAQRINIWPQIGFQAVTATDSEFSANQNPAILRQVKDERLR
jgi:hypothetical protein